MFIAIKNRLKSIKATRAIRREADTIIATFATRPSAYQNDADLRRDADLIIARLSR